MVCGGGGFVRLEVVRAQRFTNFAIKAMYALRTIQLSLSQMSILTVGSSPGCFRGMRLNLPFVNVPFLSRMDNGHWLFQPTVACSGTSRCCASYAGVTFGLHGHRIYFCESAAFYQLCHKSNLRFANNNWIRVL